MGNEPKKIIHDEFGPGKLPIGKGLFCGSENGTPLFARQDLTEKGKKKKSLKTFLIQWKYKLLATSLFHHEKSKSNNLHNSF